MAKLTLALDKGGPKRVELEWGFAFKNLRVRVDGVELGTIATKAELEAGRSFVMSDGSSLMVRRTPGLMPVMNVTRDGVPLPGSPGDPETHVRGAATVLFFIAALNAGLGVVSLVIESDFLARAGIGIASVVFGMVYGGLGYLTLRRSLIALAIGIGLFVLDGVVSLVAGAAAGRPPVAMIVMRVFLIVALVRGAQALWKAKQST